MDEFLQDLAIAAIGIGVAAALIVFVNTVLNGLAARNVEIDRANGRIP